MVRIRPATPTSGPGDDANLIPVRCPGWPVGVCGVSNLEPKDVKSYFHVRKLRIYDLPRPLPVQVVTRI